MALRRKTGRKSDKTGRSVGVDRFLGLPHYLLKCEAWKSLEPIQRALFIEVAQRWNGFNNGKIGLGIREAGSALHVKHTTAGTAFRILQDRGFVVLTQDSGFDQKRLAREWRVTAFPVGDYRAPSRPATNDFMRWKPSFQNRTQDPLGTRIGPNGDPMSRLQSPQRVL